MTDLSTPTARRLTPPTWRDSRLVLGVVLVLLATVLGAKTVSAADERETVYAAARDLVPGDRITGDDLTPVAVHLGDRSPAYLRVAGAVPGERVVTRSLTKGELVPVAATADATSTRVQTVTVPVDATSVAGLERGVLVDVYVSPQRGVGGADRVASQLLLRGVAVASTPDSHTGLGATSSTVGVQLRVESRSVERVVTEVANRSQFVLVRSAGSAQGTS